MLVVYCEYINTSMSILKNTSEHRCSCCRKQREAQSWKIYNLSDSYDTFTCHAALFYFRPSSLRQCINTENRVDAFWTPPILSAAGLCWAATDAGSRFHSELCTALPPVPPPTRAQPRPPTRTTAPQEDAVQKCAKFRQSPRNWHTRAAAVVLPGNWCQERRWRLGAEL